jgi:hypothetical protein
MKNLFHFLLIFTAIFLPGLLGQIINEDSRIELTENPGFFKFTWQSQIGRTYFVQSSDENLANWFYLPLIEAGTGGRLEYGFTTNAPRFFFRLRHTDQPAANIQTADFDDDGVSNWDELQAGLDPFKRDTDGDGMIDGYEVTMGLNPLLTDGGADKDGDTVINQEDARPSNISIGRLTAVITLPANGDIYP